MSNENEVRKNYKVLSPIAWGGERRRKGDTVSMYPSEALNIGTDYVEIIDDKGPDSAAVTTGDSNVEEKEVVKPEVKKAKKKK